MSACEHQWSAKSPGGECQLCGIRNNEPRIFVRFIYDSQLELENSFPDGNVEIRFSCLSEEWKDSFAEAASCDGWEVPPEDEEDEERSSWEYMHCQGWTAHPISPLLEAAGEDNGVLFPTNLIKELEVVTDLHEAEILIRRLHVPRVTPAWVKWIYHAPCEPGDGGRCFCDAYHPCSVNRNPRAGAAISDVSEEDEVEHKPVSKKRVSGKQTKTAGKKQRA